MTTTVTLPNGTTVTTTGTVSIAPDGTMTVWDNAPAAEPAMVSDDTLATVNAEVAATLAEAANSPVVQSVTTDGGVVYDKHENGTVTSTDPDGHVYLATGGCPGLNDNLTTTQALDLISHYEEDQGELPFLAHMYGVWEIVGFGSENPKRGETWAIDNVYVDKAGRDAIVARWPGIECLDPEEAA